jgi:hypothetical protein
MGRRKGRLHGAGESARREFRRQRWKNIRESWRLWLTATVFVFALAIWSLAVDGNGSRMLAAGAGWLAGVLTFAWALGAHISASRWRTGSEGERETAREIEKLGPDWHPEHDLEHEHGNFDHILVGPPGVFLLDSKVLHGLSAAGNDRLRSGRLTYQGAVFRSSAMRVKRALDKSLGSHAPWVQAVVVVWGDFPQGRHTEKDVVYVRGEELRMWLSELPNRLNAPRRAALVTALQEVRLGLRPERA